MRLCDRIKARRSFHEVRTAFLEEGIPLDEVLQGLKSKYAVIAGLFAERGGHATHDVPTLIEKSGKDVNYLGAVGASAWADQLLLESALQIAGTSQVSRDVKEEE